ncbi:LCP family protein [Streptomyces sp. NA02950]|uniref:LCP family protein n=1 Tax=Streptomyces sp. NA02950 TaxID=2742137 RepID=UPI0015901D77|nr:LCP family protein [Streptomyces sp. NA02950]QKV94476.1 LCP family protein [Streptomyces sp. NA02950]
MPNHWPDDWTDTGRAPHDGIVLPQQQQRPEPLRRIPPDPYQPREDDEAAPRRRWPRRLWRTVAVVLSLALVGAGTAYVWATSKLKNEVDLGRVEHRPPKGKGTNYLIVGSDSRDGLSGKDKKDLHTGSAEGRRTDSMMVLHTGAHGTTLMSLPRDSWVTLPPYTFPMTGKRPGASKNKLNAAFSLGGPELLVRTVEHNTGLRIDHYAEIGFAGFVNVVDSVGGVRMCLPRPIKDEKSGADLKKGCQTLNGAQALAFVRQRHQEAKGDLGRSQNQQKFLSALAKKATEPDHALVPWEVFPTVGAGLDTLIVDKDMDLRTLASMFEAMKGVAGGSGKQLNVPVASLGFTTRKGSAVKWDEKRAKKLFEQLRNDRPVG